MSLDLITYGHEVWRQTLPPAAPAAEWILPIVGSRGPAGDLAEQRAHWVSADTIIWPAADDPALSYRLHHDPDGQMALTTSGIGGESIRLQPTTADPAIIEKFPHLAGLPALRIPADQVERAAGWLRDQVAVSATDFDRGLADATGLQIPGVLDDLYANDAELGVTWDGDVPDTARVGADGEVRRVATVRRQRSGEHADDARHDTRPGDRGVVGHGGRHVGWSLLPVRRRGVRAVDGPGRAQPRDRPVLAVVVDQLGTLADRGPHRPGTGPGWVGRRRQARARRARGPVDLRAARA